VIQEESNTSSPIHMSVTDGTSIQVNASDARKPQTRGNNYFQACGSSKPSRF